MQAMTCSQDTSLPTRRQNPQEIWDSLTPPQKAALCCYAGKPLPLYTHLNFTVSSMRALARRGLWDSNRQKVTRFGMKVVACAPKCADIGKQLNVLVNLEP